jgi:thiol-disulfide isomerase/thioredoxin
MRIQLIAIVLVLLNLVVAAPKSNVQELIGKRVRGSMKASEGKVIFSDIYNNEKLTPEEKKYLARLYEIFFAFPEYIASEVRDSGLIPSQQSIADNFGLSLDEVDLILDVMNADSRMPTIMERGEDGEIDTVLLPEINAFIEKRGSNIRISQWLDQKIPEFSLPDFEGGTVSSSDLLGKPTVMVFWLTRCPVCRRTMPLIAELSTKYDKRVRFVGMNSDLALELDISDEERSGFARKNKLEFPNVLVSEATREAFGNLNIFPAILLIRSDGTIQNLALNYLEKKEINRLIKELRNDDIR